jgi:hypothetical protein
MNGDSLFLQRGTDFGCHHAMLGQQVLDAMYAETSSTGGALSSLSEAVCRASRTLFILGRVMESVLRRDSGALIISRSYHETGLRHVQSIENISARLYRRNHSALSGSTKMSR